jgi:hypothetical protein
LDHDGDTGRKLSEVLSAKDLKPRTVRFFKYILNEVVTLGEVRRQVENLKMWAEVIHRHK